MTQRAASRRALCLAGLLLCAATFTWRSPAADPVVTADTENLAPASPAPDAGQSFESAHEEVPVTDDDRLHWAFRPVSRPALPSVKHPGWCRTPIDRFILAALESRDLAPAPEADRLTLLRRLTFDLTGLPPAPDEIERYLADDAPDAYEQLVERLLASPAYGERWAMHWLDLARFAETDGFEHDHVRPEAWRYRDWVVSALNADLPYDRFLSLQLAADEVAPDDRAAQLATGFLLAGPDMPDLNLQEERRHVFLNSMTANVGEVLLGLQFGCAQCHDHKADPLSQYDFYRLRACFETLDLFQEQPLEVTAAGDRQRTVVKARITRTSSSSKGESRLWVRGDFRRPGPSVPPAAPRAAATTDAGAFVIDPAGPRRRELAEWLCDPANPLTSRVIVNRLWQHHFGSGIAATTSDFGLMGIGPTHPELLDWLASELMRTGWSLKELHRLMATSAVYRSASRSTPPAEGVPADDDVRAAWTRLIERDPGNRWYGRMSRRRLEGEAIRDTMLAACGTLNDRMGGPRVRPPLPPEVVKTLLKNQWPVTEAPSEHTRRSLYLFVRRNLKYPLFDVFDRPDQNLSCSRRQQTTIAPQALAMLNSEFTINCAARLADEVLAHEASAVDRTPADAVARCYLRLLGRRPTPAEQSAAEELIAAGGPAGWIDLCLALFNTSEFVYID